ncbi:SDR family NAD(P)-dependent oxidoreductase [Xylophilus sp. GOD-11R]|uniref:SDR family NAD(P)-dependent oxidoreductase n=1 Tax=Xylophilus sp. GOD-11R TaxID=3089814 RepID=UPI00298BFFEC|nr:SDR family NAD(P)-dependent oxidoreductase [Xylophilus sp. GOD-11R]WPB56958.1 SDR family NAD(P)-dependent oxidoreductase [Xylophilus sp. GOD-11R]
MIESTPSPRGTALVTGASSGIGATYAERLARRGHWLVLVARDAARLQALAARLSAETGVRAEVLVADLTAPAQRALVERRLQEDASIDLLINNAGMAVNGSLIEADIDAVETMIALNITAPTRLAAAAAKAFAARGAGTIVNVASVLAMAPELFSGTYSGTKAYMLNLSRSMQLQLAPLGVRVQAVLPGATRTEIWDRSGGSIDALPADMLMEVGDLVDAALAGLDMGEAVTIPPLPSLEGWQAMEDARLALAPRLSLREPAARYRQAAVEAL